MDIKANPAIKARVDKDHLMSTLDLVFRGGHPAEGLSDHRETHGSGEEGEDYCRKVLDMSQEEQARHRLTQMLQHMSDIM